MVCLKLKQASAREVLAEIVPWARGQFFVCVQVAVSQGQLQRSLFLTACQLEVRSELPVKFPKAKHMYKTPPLAINADAKTGDSTGYKAGACHLMIIQTQVLFPMLPLNSPSGCVEQR